MSLTSTYFCFFYSDQYEDLVDSHHFSGAHGLFANELAHQTMANDSTSRMHMDNVRSTKSRLAFHEQPYHTQSRHDSK